MVQGPRIEIGSEYEARVSNENTTWSSATYYDTLTVGVKPTKQGQFKCFIYEFNAPVSGVEFVRYAGSMTDPSYNFSMYISDDGESWNSVIENATSINGDNDKKYPPFESKVAAKYYKIFRSDQIMNFDRYGMDGNIQGQVKVVSNADADNSKMTVDGGTVEQRRYCHRTTLPRHRRLRQPYR